MARKISAVLALGFFVLAGCAASTPGSTPPPAASASPSVSETPGTPTPPSPAPPLSSTPPPTPGAPTIGPQKPTDVVSAYWTSGTITRGGTGPCYGMLTDDGVELALYTRAGLELVEGEQARVKVRVASFRIDCGPGQLMSLHEVERR